MHITFRNFMTEKHGELREAAFKQAMGQGYKNLNVLMENKYGVTEKGCASMAIGPEWVRAIEHSATEDFSNNIGMRKAALLGITMAKKFDAHLDVGYNGVEMHLYKENIAKISAGKTEKAALEALVENIETQYIQTKKNSEAFKRQLKN